VKGGSGDGKEWEGRGEEVGEAEEVAGKVEVERRGRREGEVGRLRCLRGGRVGKRGSGGGGGKLKTPHSLIYDSARPAGHRAAKNPPERE